MDNLQVSKILPSTVLYRPPYFLVCAMCGTEIYGSTPEDLAERANNKGWKYVYNQDCFLCPICYRYIKEN